MALPCRFISASAGMVTFVVGRPAAGNPLEAEFGPPGKLATLNLTSSAAPETQDAARSRRVYARMWLRAQLRHAIASAPQLCEKVFQNRHFTFSSCARSDRKAVGGDGVHLFACLGLIDEELDGKADEVAGAPVEGKTGGETPHHESHRDRQ